MNTPDFDKEMEKLKETEFEDLPLLINDMKTKAAAMNYKRVLAGENKDIQYIPSSQDEVNSTIEIKQIDDREIDAIASRMRSRRPHNPRENRVLLDDRLEKSFLNDSKSEI